MIKMNDDLRKLKPARDMRGLTLFEVLVAIAILSVVLIGMAVMISAGFVQLRNLEIKRSAANCARMIVEYLETLPPDSIYGLSPHEPMEGNFASESAMQELNAFVSNSDTACRQMSDKNENLGKAVQMKYYICPGCVSRTQVNADGMKWTTCAYFFRVRVTFNGLGMAHGQKIDYPVKFYRGSMGSCTDIPTGCGEQESETELKDCVLP